ncbi:MAG: STAS domain-containing protein [Actinomycetota bacterium]|nr:STAS domain-containing protein [Actinomycetota bacterium]
MSQLARTLRELGAWARLIVFDLRELELIDYFGVHAIANASTRAREVGRRLVVVSGVPEIDRMFTLAGRLHEVEIGDLESGEPAAQALRRLTAQQLEPHNGRPSPEVAQGRPLR